MTISFSLDDIEGEKEEAGIESEKEEVQEEWTAVRRVVGSNPPIAGDVNTSPYQYESGYTSVQRKTVPDIGSTCIPTAMCNLLKYYTDRKRMKSSLLLNNDWKQTLDRLTALLGERKYMIDTKIALDNYFKEIDVQDAITHHYDEEETHWKEMKWRIDCGDPFIYNTYNHYKYVAYDKNGDPINHAVLAVGYLQFNYPPSGLNQSRYLQVADGWTERSNRYINIDIGNDASQDEMVTLYFVYSYIQK